MTFLAGDTSCMQDADHAAGKGSARMPEPLYKAVFEHVGVAILVVDQGGGVLSGNVQVPGLTGYSLDDLRAMRRWTDILEPGQQARVLDWIRENHVAEAPPRSFESTITCKNGQKVFVQATISRCPHRGELLVALADISEIKKNERLLYYKAFHDHLTGLPNRALFMEILDLAIRRARRNQDYLFAVLYLDIDRFKPINDSMGHLVGDHILVRLAEIVKKCLRDSDMVARLGGDEFAVFLDDVHDAEYVATVTRRIFAMLEQPMDIEGHRIFLNLSVGIVDDCRGYESSEAVIKDADAAMYGAKEAGRSCSKVFNTRMHRRFRHILDTEQALRHALEQDEFILYYQPIVSMENGLLHSFEALIRWERPGIGLIPPAEFISVAEKTGLVHPLGRWILHKACTQMSRWREAYPVLANCSVCVNLSSCQCRDPNLENTIAHALRTANLPARNLQLEITECKDLLDAQPAIETLTQIRKLGIKIMVDDFGAGSSSLKFLHCFPIDVVKVDRSFVDLLDNAGRPDEHGIVKSIIALAHSLDLDVVAEGVERASQRDILADLQCKYVQGYLYYRPMPPELIQDGFMERITAQAAEYSLCGSRAAVPAPGDAA